MSQYSKQKQYAAYKTAYQTTDNKTQQVVMIYDGLMRVIYQAKQAITDDNIEERFNLLDKASQVILGLQASLDFEHGGDIARILDGYYDSIYARIHLVNQSNSIMDCDTLIEDIKAMRASWQYVLEVTSQDGKKPENLPEDPSDVHGSNLQVSI